MNGIKNLVGMDVEVEITGKTFFSGILVDVGLDILVLYNGKKYLYIPMLHLHNMRKRILGKNEVATERPEDHMVFQQENETVSYRKTLLNAKGIFIEINVTGNRAIHGYIKSVLNDYIVFYSPVFKTMFISMHHLKWLTPYTNNLTPYTLSHTHLPVAPSNIPLARSFDDQLKKYEGQMIIFDLGDHSEKVGLVDNISDNMIELITAEGNKVYWKINHLKTAHLP